MTIERSAILGMGFYVPPKVVTNEELAKLMDTSDEWIRERTGIIERRYVEGEVGVADLALPAAKTAIERAGLTKDDIDLIVLGTLSPDYQFPGSGVILQAMLDRPGIPAIDIRQQCTGFLYGLSIADLYVRAGIARNALVVGAEVHSTGLDFTTRGRDVTVIFGDGAGAAVVGAPRVPGQGILSCALHADGSYAKELWCDKPGSRHQPRITAADLERGDHFPTMKGRTVFKHAVTKMPAVLDEALRGAGVKLDDLDIVVPHQANLRISEFVQGALKIPAEKMVHNIQRYGNTTAASIPIALCEAWEEGRVKPGALVGLVAFGAGFTWASTIIRW
jgi:3-oxoacyl-[acyl-carrier-protein] synthase-3